MGKHRLDRRNDQAWGGPDLTSMADSDLPATHPEQDDVTAPSSHPVGEVCDVRTDTD
jgi:hypothetical protein